MTGNLTLKGNKLYFQRYLQLLQFPITNTIHNFRYSLDSSQFKVKQKMPLYPTTE